MLAHLRILNEQLRKGTSMWRSRNSRTYAVAWTAVPRRQTRMTGSSNVRRRPKYEAPSTSCLPITPHYAIDPTIVPSLPSLPGLAGGPPRLVGVVLGPNGQPEEFVIDEVVFQPKNAEDLNEFLAKYNGTVLRDGRPHLLPGVSPPPGLPETTGWYLIHVDLNRSSLDDMAFNLEKSGLFGRWSFSSEKLLGSFRLRRESMAGGSAPTSSGTLPRRVRSVSIRSRRHNTWMRQNGGG